jgi:hypothetical protein
MRLILEEYKIPSWNSLYSGKHWATRSEMAKFAHQLVKVALLNVGWTNPPFKSKVSITVIAHLKRPIDPDNVCAKIIIDGFKLCGVIKDDTYKYVKKVTTSVIKDVKDYVVIEII